MFPVETIKIVCTPVSPVTYLTDTILGRNVDEKSRWKRSIPDSMPMQGPFTPSQRLNVDIEYKRIEHFFYLLFDAI